MFSSQLPVFKNEEEPRYVRSFYKLLLKAITYLKDLDVAILYNLFAVCNATNFILTSSRNIGMKTREI